jgi:hypothetical protein
LFISGVNIYAAGFLSGMIGSKGDLKQRILGTLCYYSLSHTDIKLNKQYLTIKSILEVY